MGGRGSGRKPDPLKNERRQNAPFKTGRGEEIYIPNLSGVKREIREGTHNITTDDLAEGSTNLYDKTVVLNEDNRNNIYMDLKNMSCITLVL